MRLKPEQLGPHLQKNLAPVYLVSGDEPLQQMELCDAIRATARSRGFAERQVLEVERGFNWNSLTETANAMSLFAEQRLIELRLGSGPGVEGGKILSEYCSAPPSDIVLLISMAKLDQRSLQGKWFKAVDKAGVTIRIWPIGIAELPGWIRQRCRQRGFSIDTDAAGLIAEKVEGNLLAAAQEIEKLRLLAGRDDGGHVDIDSVAAAVADSSRYDAFAPINSAYSGDLGRALRVLDGLRNEGVDAIAIYGALMWQLRRSCSVARARRNGESEQSVFKRLRLYDKQQQSIRQICQRHSAEQLEHVLHAAGRIDGQLKGYAAGDPWQSLGAILARLAGQPTIPAATR